MYCKNCGTKQKEGQKFCPKCGTPYPVVEMPKSEAQHNNSQEKQEQKKEATNQTSTTPPPPPNNGQGNTPPPVDKLTDMAEDFIKQGDKFLKETIDPHLDKGIDKLMETDWKSKAKKVNEAILHFDVKKLKRKHWIYTGIGCVVLFIGGLFFSLFMLVACNSCSLGNIDKHKIEDEIVRFWGKDIARNPHVTSIKKIHSDPPIYRFEYDFDYDLYRDGNFQRYHRAGSFGINEDGEIDNLVAIDVY